MPPPAGAVNSDDTSHIGDWHIYNNDTGEIVQTGSSTIPGDHLWQVVPPEHAIAAGSANPMLHHYKDGVLQRMPEDVLERRHARVLLRNPHMRWDHKLLDWIDPRTPEVKKQQDSDERRAQRDAALAACDWTQAADAPLTDAKRAEWKAYRKALRDLPGVKGFPDVALPTPPGK